jgi:hypothetical protein
MTDRPRPKAFPTPRDFTIYGINPDVAYYDLIAAERPDMFEDWGKQVQWGEKRKYNVAPNTTDADFVLTPATASLSGTLTIPAGSRFMIPFRDEANDFPATIIMLQRKGVIYKDVLDGIEVMSTPSPEGATTTTYAIDHIAPGKFKAIFMNYGLPTQIVDNVEITDGDNTLNTMYLCSWPRRFWIQPAESSVSASSAPPI